MVMQSDHGITLTDDCLEIDISKEVRKWIYERNAFKNNYATKQSNSET